MNFKFIVGIALLAAGISQSQVAFCMEMTANHKLLYSVFKGDEIQVKNALDHYADVNCTNCDGQTPLNFATTGNYIEIVKLLLIHGADVNQADKYWRTPLHYASLRNYLNIAKLLLDYGADTNCKDCLGATALDKAKQRNSTEFIELITNEAEKREMMRNYQTLILNRLFASHNNSITNDISNLLQLQRK
jgi:ankyrin repeat protein